MLNNSEVIDETPKMCVAKEPDRDESESRHPRDSSSPKGIRRAKERRKTIKIPNETFARTTMETTEIKVECGTCTMKSHHGDASNVVYGSLIDVKCVSMSQRNHRCCVCRCRSLSIVKWIIGSLSHLSLSLPRSLCCNAYVSHSSTMSIWSGAISQSLVVKFILFSFHHRI